MIDRDRVGHLCLEVGQYLRRAHARDAAEWYEARGRDLLRGDVHDQAAVFREVHSSISAGSAGPLGVVVVDELGRADVEATTEYRETLGLLYRLTTRSSFADWLKSLTG